ncbi:hypothetical protein [Gordonia phthalatica]|uniref:Uncharacterized protein n=1 Tax=Gordonia phthalatica TaxID=1136941 RepID=A0A0N9MZU5_9ACTN|nr:hypothetical protein [Gordonia phthalatica]ALG83772.1 hypothetical protein ACH46_03665 [Gordonia phthalatica]
MNSDVDPEWAAEPQWKVTYIAQRVAASGGVVRDRGLPPASWYLTPWEVDAVLAEGSDFGQLVNRNDPRLPRPVSAHAGPAVVTLTCTRCGYTADAPSDFRSQHPTCLQAVSAPAEPVPAQPERNYADPSCREAWMAAAQTGTLVEGIDAGWPSRDREVLEPWTVELSFDVDAYSREHAEQIANLLAMITGGRISGLS